MDELNQNQETQEETNENQEGGTEEQKTVDFDDLLKTNKDFGSWLDRRITKATATAVKNARSKWEVLQNQNLSESEKLKTMTAEEKASYFQQKLEAMEAAQQRRENARSLEKQAADLFSENQIPTELLSSIDFENASAQQVQDRVKLLSSYEIFKKGTFEERLNRALDERLKQRAPQTHTSSAAASNVEELLEKARENNDTQAIVYYSRLAAEEKQK